MLGTPAPPPALSAKREQYLRFVLETVLSTLGGRGHARSPK